MDATNKDILRKYINNECTPQELTRVNSIMKTPIYNKLMEQVLSEEDNPIKASSIPTTPQMQEWLEKIDQRIAKGSSTSKFKTTSRSFPLGYVAVWLLITVGLGIFGLHYYNKPTKQPITTVWIEKQNPRGQRTLITLSDSTVVLLGPQSRLRFTERFFGAKRQVYLDGEAFFNVVHNPRKPFIVHTTALKTRVLGTSFKITAYKKTRGRVTVATGKVAINNTRDNKELGILLPGRQLSYNGSTTRIKNVDIRDVEDWKRGRLVYRKTPLGSITEELERWYDVDIRLIDPKKSKLLMDINIETNLSINRIMKVLSKTAHFTYKIHNKTIIIK